MSRAARRPRRARRRTCDTRFAASGTTITFPGYRQVYVESTDDGAADDGEREALLPALAEGDVVARRPS